MTQTTDRDTGFEPTSEMRERHDDWLTNYGESVVSGFIAQGVVEADSAHADRIRIACIEDMKVTSRPVWMDPIDAVAVAAVHVEGIEITDPALRLDYQDALRTLTGLSRHQRLLLIADALGLSPAAVRRYDLERPVVPNLTLSGRTSLYRHFDHAGVLLYVGIAKDPDVRFSLHRSTSAWAQHSADMRVEWYETRDDALRAERQAIAAERPLFNISGNPYREAKR